MIACTSTSIFLGMLEPVSRETIHAAVLDAVSKACDPRSIIGRGATVLIKPNVFCPKPAPVSTDPRVVASLVAMARDIRVILIKLADRLDNIVSHQLAASPRPEHVAKVLAL